MAELQFPNIAGNLLAGYNQGRQQARSDRFNALAGQAVADPRQRDALISQAVALDPEAGFALSKQLESDTDRRQTQVYNLARGFKQIYGKNPQAAMTFFQRQIAPGLSRLGFDVDPNTPEADILPVVDQVLAAYQPTSETSGQVQGQFITDKGTVGYLTRGGTPVDTGVKVAPQTQLINQAGQVPYLAVTGRGQLGQTIGLGGAREAPPVSVTSDSTQLPPSQGSFAINFADLSPEQNAKIQAGSDALRNAGYSEDEVGGWVSAQYGTLKGMPSGPQPVRNPTAAEQAAQQTQGRIQAERELQRPQDLAQGEQDLRKEVNTRLQEPRTILSAYSKVKEAAKNPSAPNDLALIFAYMKMLDPGSVVREGEFANAQNAAGIPDRIKNLYNRAIDGQRLNDDQRMQFVQSADGIAGTARDQVNAVARQYQTTAKQYGYDVERATGLPDFSDTQSAVSATTPTPKVKGLPTPQTQADFDRLPSGALFIDPDDGKTYRKP